MAAQDEISGTVTIVNSGGPPTPTTDRPLGDTPTAADVVRMGQYHVLSMLGRGGMGVVYAGVHTRLKRPVAIKVLHDRRTDDSGVRRFLREMALIGQLRHPHVVQAFDAGEVGGHHFLVMEQIEGGDTEKIARRFGVLRICDACDIARQASLGLAHAHAAGLIHRDIKPSNLLVGRDGVVKVADLGLARELVPIGPDAADTSRLCFIGTPDYAAPEQALTHSDSDARADLYSLGCTLYRLLIGQPPFPSPEYETPFSKLTAHAQVTPPSLIEARPETPLELSRLLEKLLAKSPNDRPASAQELAGLLTPFCAGADLAALVRELPREAPPPAMEVSQGLTWLETLVSPHPLPTPQASLPPPQSPRKRLVRMFAAGGLVLAAALAGFEISRRSMAPRIFEITPAEKVARGVWHDLLLVEPDRFAWPRDATLTLNRGRLWVSASGTALLKIGRAPYDTYQLEMEMLQRTWHGRVGVWFACNPVTVDQYSGQKLRCIYIRERARGRGPPHYALGHMEMGVFVVDGIQQVNTSITWEKAIHGPHREGAKLRINVSNSKLTRVQWDGVDYPDICKLPGPATGDFGLHVEGAGAEFFNGRILPR